MRRSSLYLVRLGVGSGLGVGLGLGLGQGLGLGLGSGLGSGLGLGLGVRAAPYPLKHSGRSTYFCTTCISVNLTHGVT